MAYSVNWTLLTLRARQLLKKAELCRFCGEPTEFVRDHSDYSFRLKTALCCKNRCEAVRLTSDFPLLSNAGGMDLVEGHVISMLNLWNFKNDTPSFMVGLS